MSRYINISKSHEIIKTIKQLTFCSSCLHLGKNKIGNSNKNNNNIGINRII